MVEQGNERCCFAEEGLARAAAVVELDTTGERGEERASTF
jgi:hypothetical protein